MHVTRRHVTRSLINKENMGAAAGGKAVAASKSSRSRPLGPLAVNAQQEQSAAAGGKVYATRSRARVSEGAPAAAASSKSALTKNASTVRARSTSTARSSTAAAAGATGPARRTSRVASAAASDPPKVAAPAPPPPAPIVKAEPVPAAAAHVIRSARTAADIDERDHQEPLAFTEYVDGLYNHLREQEVVYRIPADLMEEQPYINARMRAILVDWLVEVHMRFRLVPDTLYLAIYALDRYLAAATVAREGLQVAGVAALLLASKYEEIYPPEMCDLVYVTDRACAREAILAAERDMLARLEFRLTVPTVYCFLLRYLKAAHADRCIVQLACYISERMLLEARMLRHLPSVAASAAVYLSRRACNRNAWSPTLARYTGYNVAALTPCLRDICEAMRRPCDLRASKRKFGTREFGAVSSLDVDWTV